MSTGDTIINIAKYRKNNKCEIWGFEPHRELFCQAKAGLEAAGIKNVHLVHMAIAEEDGIIGVGSYLG